MFGSKLEAANARNLSLVALLASVGVAVATEGDLPSAESVKADFGAKQKKAVDDAVAPVSASLATQKATAEAFVAGFTAAGVKLEGFKPEDLAPKMDAKEGDLTPAASAVKSAIESAVAGKAARQVAASGHPNALEVDAKETNGNAAAETPASAEDFLKTYRACAKTDPTKAAEYFAKHEAKFPVR